MSDQSDRQAQERHEEYLDHHTVRLDKRYPDQPQPQRHPPITFSDPETKQTVTLLDAGETASAQVISEAFAALVSDPEQHVIVVINRPPRSGNPHPVLTHAESDVQP